MKAPRRLLVIKLSSLGDLFHALPAVRALKEFGVEEVHWVTQPEYCELLSCFDDVDLAIPFPRKNFASKGVAFFKKLRLERYDAVIDFQGLFKSAGVACAARSKMSVGPSFLKEAPPWIYTQVAKSRGLQHAADTCMDSAVTLGADGESLQFPVSFPAEQRKGLSSKRVGLAPYSRWPAKNWPLSAFGELANELIQQAGVEIILIGGPADRPALEELKGQIEGPVTNTAGELSLIALGSAIASLDLLITNDSGPMHIADALGTPLVALFGPTDPDRTGPYQQREFVIRPRFEPGKEPEHRAYRDPDASIIERITVSEVYTLAVKRLDEAK